MRNKKLISDMVREFYPFAKKKLGFDQPANIVLRGDSENAKDPLGKTGFYDPQTRTVYAYITSRHPKDVVRSISHELVHHMQNCKGELEQDNNSNTELGYAQNNPHLREMEKQAYELGSMIFRDWEDMKKQSDADLLREAEEKEEVDPLKKEKANDHYAKRAEVIYKENLRKLGIVPKEDVKEDKK